NDGRQRREADPVVVLERRRRLLRVHAGRSHDAQVHRHHGGELHPERGAASPAPAAGNSTRGGSTPPSTSRPTSRPPSSSLMVAANVAMGQPSISASIWP